MCFLVGSDLQRPYISKTYENKKMVWWVPWGPMLPALETPISVCMLSPELPWSTRCDLLPRFCSKAESPPQPSLVGTTGWMRVRKHHVWKSRLAGTGQDNHTREPQDYTTKEEEEALFSFLLQNPFKTLEIFHKRKGRGRNEYTGSRRFKYFD